MAQKILGAQRDFSYGEVDPALKRADDHPARKSGLRQMANARILNSGSVQDRPGRRALFPMSNGCTRTDEFTISPGNTFKISFGTGRLQIIDKVGTVVGNFPSRANGAPFTWATATVSQIRYAVMGLSIYVTFPGQIPQVVTWDGATSWSIADYTESVVGGQKRTFFYRISAQGIAIQPSARTGSGITITSSGATGPFSAAQVGTRIRFVGRQILITGYNSPAQVIGTVEEPLPGSQVMAFSSDPAFLFSVGDVVVGSVSGARGVVYSVDSGLNSISVQLLTLDSNSVTSIDYTGVYTQTFAFTTSDVVVGPGGALTPVTASAIGTPLPVTVWDEEVMNAYRGYPASVFADQFRLGFCNFPGVPNGIGWSAINNPGDLYVGANPSNAIFELAPAKVQIYDVVPGPESSEFVFCDRGVYYIPISPANPLKPGSVQFQVLSGDGAANVKPRIAQETILYANAGQNSVIAIVATGAYQRPFNTRNLCEFHAHLFNGITAIAAPTADGTFNERYAYVMNSDGSVVVGKYSVSSLLSDAVPQVGWGPWSGVGAVSWVSAWAADVLFTSSYFGTAVCEILDDTVYLDCAISVNSPPAAFAAPVGKGPLWFIPSQTVSLMDQVTRSMGTYQIDGNGFIVAQSNAGEDLTAASLVAGQSWTTTVEPFCPDAPPGSNAGQRMFKRRIGRMTVYVIHSTGFVMARLFSGPITPTSPALGTVMNTRRVTAWNQDDDPTLPPPQRETAERWRPIGRSYDPRVAIIKDTPGPLLIAELGMEATI